MNFEYRLHSDKPVLVATSETFPAGRKDVKERWAGIIKRPGKEKEQKQDENRNDLQGNLIN